ncbi:hypothetical protein LVJ94_27630 [Pendulispora rubella]|uniref:Uncharacterized protein n=1 Tax=Pendulispora rubella TaxID=2741070 RepID=A0ABZ2KPU7_9BACT
MNAKLFSSSSLLLALPTLAAILTVAPHAAADDAAAAPAPSPPAAEVRVTSDRENTTLLRLSRAGTGFGSVGGYNVAVAFESYEPLCTAPCTTSADPNGIYRIAGEGITPSSTFRLPGHTHADLRVHAGSSSKRWWGWASTYVGTALVVGGASFLIMDAISPATSYDVNTGKDERKTTFRDIGLIGLVSGAPFLVVGIVMLATSGTDVSTASGETLARHSPRPGKLSLSPTGLVF